MLSTLLDVTLGEDIVGLVAKNLSGSARPGGVNANAMDRMLVSFGGHSRKLRCAFARLTMWLSNGHPRWEAYEAMMIGRLVGFEKMPGGAAARDRRHVINVLKGKHPRQRDTPVTDVFRV